MAGWSDLMSVSFFESTKLYWHDWNIALAVCHIYKEWACNVKPNKVKDKISFSFFMGSNSLYLLSEWEREQEMEEKGRLHVSETGMNNTRWHVSACYMIVLGIIHDCLFISWGEGWIMWIDGLSGWRFCLLTFDQCVMSFWWTVTY